MRRADGLLKVVGYSNRWRAWTCFTHCPYVHRSFFFFHFFFSFHILFYLFSDVKWNRPRFSLSLSMSFINIYILPACCCCWWWFICFSNVAILAFFFHVSWQIRRECWGKKSLRGKDNWNSNRIWRSLNVPTAASTFTGRQSMASHLGMNAGSARVTARSRGPSFYSSKATTQQHKH